MKEKFISFMKKHRAFDEFKMEIRPYTMTDFNAQLLDGGAEFMLGDGNIFFWTSAKTDIDWEKLNRIWQKECNV